MPRGKDDDEDEKVQWDCVRGITWERAKREARPWLSGIYASQTDDFNLWQAAIGMDLHGDAVGAPALPGGPGNAAALGKRARRQNKLWTVAVQMAANEKVKTMLLALPDGDIVVPAGGARGIGRRAWLLLEGQGAAPIDDEYTQRMLTQFVLCDIASTVGYRIGSVTEFYRHITNLVFLVPAAQQPDDTRYAIKILECLGKESPDSLALEATKELKAAVADRRFMLAGGAARDLQAIILYFSDMWDHMVRARKISERAVSSRAPSTSTLTTEVTNELVHGTEGALVVGDQIEAFDNDDAMTIEQYNALVSSTHVEVSFTAGARRGGMQRRSPRPVSQQIICFCCKGLGHRQDQCPSDEDPQRTIAAVHSVLGEAMAGNQGSSRPLVPSDVDGHAARSPARPISRPRPGTPNGPRRPAGQRPPPYGSTPANAGRRIPFRPFRPRPRALVGETEEEGQEDDGDGNDADTTLSADFCVEINCVTVAGRQTRAKASERKERADSRVDSSPKGPAPVTNTVTSVNNGARAVKLMLYHVNDYNDCHVLVHKRDPARGGNMDMNGVMMMANESLEAAVRRCIAKEFDDNSAVLASSLIALGDCPDGHATFDMQIYGRVNQVKILAVFMPPNSRGELSNPMGNMFVTTRTTLESAHWATVDSAYSFMLIQKMSLARGMRAALERAGCHGTSVPRSPRGFFSEANPDGDADSGRFTAFIVTAGSTGRVKKAVSMRLRGGIPNSPALVTTLPPLGRTPVELIPDNVVTVQFAFREGNSIGMGVFASQSLTAGTLVGSLGDGAAMPVHVWDMFAQERMMPEWAAFESTRRNAQNNSIKIFDASWVDNRHEYDPRPNWSMFNHSKYRANCAIHIPDGAGWKIEWRLTKDVPMGTEITFDYGANTGDWDAMEAIALFGKGGLRHGRGNWRAAPGQGSAQATPPTSQDDSPQSVIHTLAATAIQRMARGRASRRTARRCACKAGLCNRWAEAKDRRGFCSWCTDYLLSCGCRCLCECEGYYGGGCQTDLADLPPDMLHSIAMFLHSDPHSLAALSSTAANLRSSEPIMQAVKFAKVQHESLIVVTKHLGQSFCILQARLDFLRPIEILRGLNGVCKRFNMMLKPCFARKLTHLRRAVNDRSAFLHRHTTLPYSVALTTEAAEYMLLNQDINSFGNDRMRRRHGIISDCIIARNLHHHAVRCRLALRVIKRVVKRVVFAKRIATRKSNAVNTIRYCWKLHVLRKLTMIKMACKIQAAHHRRNMRRAARLAARERRRQDLPAMACMLQRAWRRHLLKSRMYDAARLNRVLAEHAQDAAYWYIYGYNCALAKPIYMVRPPDPPSLTAYVLECTGGQYDHVALSSASERKWATQYRAKILNQPTWDEQWKEWIVDSGATRHVVNSVDELTYAAPLLGNNSVRVGNNQELPITHIGGVTLMSADYHGSDGATMELTNVLVVPKIGPRLFATGHGFTEDGIKTYLNDELKLVTRNNKSIEFTDHPSHYSFVARLVQPTSTVMMCEPIAMSSTLDLSMDLSVAKSPAELLHERLGHFSIGRIISAKGKSKGLPLDGITHDPLRCEPCMLNSKRAPVQRLSAAQQLKSPRYTAFGQCVQSDLIKMLGSMPHEFMYGMVFNDRASNWLDVRFTKTKEPDGVLSGLESWVTSMQSALDAHGGLKEWHTDNGGEFRSDDIQEFCNELSARHSRTVPETPQDNAGAERGNGIMLRQTRILLAAANLSDALWPFAFKYVCFVHNSLPSRAHTPPISPYEFVYNRLPNLNIIHKFGCKCFVPLSETEQQDNVKTAPTSAVAVHLGYDQSTGGYHVYVPALKQFTVAHGVRFVDEEYFAPPEVKRNETYAKRAKNKSNDGLPQSHDSFGGTRRMREDDVPTPAEEAEPEAEDQVTFAQGISDQQFELSMAQLPHSNIPDWCLNPSSYEEAIHPDNVLAPMWKESMTKELVGKMKNGKHGFAKVVSILEAQQNKRVPMKVKWVFKAKLNLDGSVKELKARLVAKGFVQRKGIDYESTFASTIRAATVRLFFALVAKLDLDLALADVVKAFTQAELDKLIYAEMPQGFEQNGMCLQLFMSLEGMKQSAHLWQKLLADVLVSKLQFTRSLIDPCLYSKHFDDGSKMILIVWVDDIAIGHNSIEKLRGTMKELNKSINCTFDESMKSFLGMEIVRDRKQKTLTITQKTYVTRMFEQHMSASNSKSWKHVTPCGTSREDAHRFMSIGPTDNAVESEMNIKRGYLSMIGAIMFAMCFTRPDIAFHTSHLARCMQSPSTNAYEAVLNLMHYMYHTRDLGISFGPIDKNRIANDQADYSEPRGWHDASFGTREDGFDPYGGGYVEYYYGPVIWQARKLKFIPLSTCEAEVAAMVNMAKEIVFIRNILVDLGDPPNGPSVMVTDSKAANDTVVNPGATKHTVHFERWLHFARSLHLKNVIKSTLLGTDYMRADDKTKVVDKKKFLMCRRETMNLSPDKKDS